MYSTPDSGVTYELVTCFSWRNLYDPLGAQCQAGDKICKVVGGGGGGGGKWNSCVENMHNHAPDTFLPVVAV